MSTTGGPLMGSRVLVLEDDYYLATDLRDALEAAGAEVVGPFSEASEAGRAADDVGANAALVDLNLGQGISFELPRKLSAMGIPFAFVTGYDRSAIADEFADVPRVEKPIEPRRAVALVKTLLSAHLP